MTGCAPSWRSRRGPGSRRCGVGGVPSLIGLHFRFSHDGLRAELEEQKGPWFEEVRGCKAPSREVFRVLKLPWGGWRREGSPCKRVGYLPRQGALTPLGLLGYLFSVEHLQTPPGGPIIYL